MTKGFWTNWDEDEVNEMQAELATIEHLEHLKYEVGHLKTLVRDTSTGHIRTAISVLEDRIKELTPKPQPKRLFEVEVVKRDSYAYTPHKKQFESADEAWKFYDGVLKDPYWLAQEPVTIRK
jgi:hypothetical protein